MLHSESWGLKSLSPPFGQVTYIDKTVYFTEKALNEDMDAKTNKQPAIENGEPVGSKTIQYLVEIFANHNSTSLGTRDESRADHVNFRQLLWKAMASFPEVAEQKSRDVVPLFLRFVR